MSLRSWLAAPPADAAVEISPEGVAAAAVSFRDRGPAVHASALEPLPPGAVVASLTGHNVVNAAAVGAALRTVTSALGTRPRRIALLLPDLTARVSLLRFEKLPARGEDLDQLVRWQLRKAAPFPVEEAQLTYAHAARDAGGTRELVAVLARRSVVREYEAVCEEAGLEPGLVDLSTFGLVNLLLAASSPRTGDWLLVHVRPEYVALVIMRGDALIFFRNVPAGEGDALADAAHQTAMYYQDRLSGGRFARVVLCGVTHAPGGIEAVRRALEQRLDAAVEIADATDAVALRDRLQAPPELAALVAPLAGTLLRMHAGAHA